MKIILLSLLLTAASVGGGYLIGKWLARDMIKYIKELFRI